MLIKTWKAKFIRFLNKHTYRLNVRMLDKYIKRHPSYKYEPNPEKQIRVYNILFRQYREMLYSKKGLERYAAYVELDNYLTELEKFYLSRQ